MNGKELLEEMNLIDDDLLVSNATPPKKRKPIVFVALIAAVLAL